MCEITAPVLCWIGCFTTTKVSRKYYELLMHNTIYTSAMLDWLCCSLHYPHNKPTFFQDVMLNFEYQNNNSKKVQDRKLSAYGKVVLSYGRFILIGLDHFYQVTDQCACSFTLFISLLHRLYAYKNR